MDLLTRAKSPCLSPTRDTEGRYASLSPPSVTMGSPSRDARIASLHEGRPEYGAARPDGSTPHRSFTEVQKERNASRTMLKDTQNPTSLSPERLKQDRENSHAAAQAFMNLQAERYLGESAMQFGTESLRKNLPHTLTRCALEGKPFFNFTEWPALVTDGWALDKDDPLLEKDAGAKLQTVLLKFVDLTDAVSVSCATHVDPEKAAASGVNAQNLKKRQKENRKIRRVMQTCLASTQAASGVDVEQLGAPEGASTDLEGSDSDDADHGGASDHDEGRNSTRAKAQARKNGAGKAGGKKTTTTSPSGGGANYANSSHVLGAVTALTGNKKPASGRGPTG
ncbi:unnamed protein product, partial [Amoebophrya sp. A25]|eukprot:GSA25T00024081001.1